MAELKQPVRPPDPAQPDPPVSAPPVAASRARAILAWLGLIAVVISAVVGSNMFSVRDRLFGSEVPEATSPVASRDAFTAVGQIAPTPTKLRSQPWWQDVMTLNGTGTDTTAPFTIVRGASQWRLTASCSSGRIVARAPGEPKPVIDAACSKGTVGYATGAGAIRLDVQADGPWHLAISQQIDAPLVEPPLPAMTGPGTKTVATGSFYKVDKTAKGTVTIYRQADGRSTLRFERFFVSPTSDLEVRLSSRRAPRTSQQYLSARSRLVSRMDATAGSLNYSVPAGIDPARFGSVVIWCPATASAYAAASLRTTR